MFEMGMGGASLYERRMSELVAAQDRSLRCIRAELRETRRRFNELQRAVEMYVRMGRLPQDVLYEPNDYTPHEVAPIGASLSFSPRHISSSTCGGANTYV